MDNPMHTIDSLPIPYSNLASSIIVQIMLRGVILKQRLVAEISSHFSVFQIYVYACSALTSLEVICEYLWSSSDYF